MNARLSPQREAEILARAEAATPGPWSSTVIDAEVTSIRAGGQTARDSIRIGWLRNTSPADTALITHAPEDVDALLAELAAVRAERDEALENPTGAYLARWEEEQDNARLRLALESAKRGRKTLRTELAKYVGSKPTAAEELAYLTRCLDAVYALCDEAKRSDALGITIEAVEEAADGVRPDTPTDRRRRIYIDGKGNGWIDLNCDAATGERNVAGLTDQWQIKSTDEVREATGSIREIGRCW